MKKFLKKINDKTKILRWILLIIIGMVLACYGFAQILVLERLEFSDIIKIAAIFAIGITSFIIGLVYMQRRTLELAVNPNKEIEQNNDINDRGPNVVVIGGGTGLTSVLKGLKNYTNNITAIVTVSTYGNSKNKLPTDDIKSSIISLAKNTEDMNKIMNYKLKSTKSTFGDLFLSATKEVYGEFATSIEKTNNIISMVGKVLPVTLDEMKICAELENGMVVEDKDKISEIVSDKITKINRVYISPSNCRTTPGVVEAIKNADAIIIGPGSLYTNVIPNLLIRNVAKTIRDSKAFKIYVSNIMTEPGNTDDYDVSEHIDAIKAHAGQKIVDYCICDNGDIIPEFLRKYSKEGSSLVNIDTPKLRGKGIRVIKGDVSYIEGEYIRHNPDELAKIIMELICNELKFRDKQNDEQYLLLNAKLKEEKKKQSVKKIKKQPIKVTNKEKGKKHSKFSSKYQDRIKSIKESEETRLQNRKLYEKSKKITDAEEKKEKEKFLKDTYIKNKK